MDYQRYVQSAQQAAQLTDAGDYDGAIRVLRSLLASDISDLDKAMMCFNLAVVHDKLGRSSEALAWYDEGIAYEHPHRRFYVTEQKAAYLAQAGRVPESLRIYKELLTHSDLTESDKERVRTNIKLLQERGA